MIATEVQFYWIPIPALQAFLQGNVILLLFFVPFSHSIYNLCFKRKFYLWINIYILSLTVPVQITHEQLKQQKTIINFITTPRKAFVLLYTNSSMDK